MSTSDPSLAMENGKPESPKALKPDERLWRAMREQYEIAGKSARAISIEFGVVRSTLQRRIKKEGWIAPEEGGGASPLRLQRKQKGEALVGRLYRSVEVQLEALEARLNQLRQEGEGTTADAGNLARTVATLAKTLELLLGLNQMEPEGDAYNAEEERRLRQDLAHRLAALCGAQPSGGSA
ncbi:hypothetical protein E1162_07420 [Rhodobacteraceae bacterium RKSG542]|uniref:hypothetical protein n=1 Tax=Pseudovibrio flavus TaxID=2529854 RepID=UPI0012BC2E0F|nr:hypothetical protein [Pseudovibrio flavus]MTI17067.1 hypothetical protein [Pseudovibrio flavus]